MRKFLLVLILILIVASCLFPPWRRIYKAEDSNIKKYEPLGYSFIAAPPMVSIYRGNPQVKAKADTIDFDRLGLQLGLLIFLGFCIVFSKYIFPQKESKPKTVISNQAPPKKNAETLTYLTILSLAAYGTLVTIALIEAEKQYSALKMPRTLTLANLKPIEEIEALQPQTNTLPQPVQTVPSVRTPRTLTLANLKPIEEIEALQPPVAPSSGGINMQLLEELERKYGIYQSEQRQAGASRQSCVEVIDEFEDETDCMPNFDDDRYEPEQSYNNTFSNSDSTIDVYGRPAYKQSYLSTGFGGLKIDAYGLGVHSDQYGRPVTLKPDFGSVPGEQLQIKHDAYGLGVHMDQYGRPVREYPYP